MNDVTLLIVDDDDFVRQTLARILKLERNRIVTAADGRSALQLAHSVSPDLIILPVGVQCIEIGHPIDAQDYGFAIDDKPLPAVPQGGLGDY